MAQSALTDYDPRAVPFKKMDKAMTTRMMILCLALLGCGRDANAPEATPTDVRGDWRFVGRVQYGNGTVCHDSLTMSLTQDRETVSGRSADWRFVCGSEPSGPTPALVGSGMVRGDSVGLRWVTDQSWTQCQGCLALVMVGIVDSIMRGWYRDPLGVVGEWQATR